MSSRAELKQKAKDLLDGKKGKAALMVLILYNAISIYTYTINWTYHKRYLRTCINVWIIKIDD